MKRKVKPSLPTGYVSEITNYINYVRYFDHIHISECVLCKYSICLEIDFNDLFIVDDSVIENQKLQLRIDEPELSDSEINKCFDWYNGESLYFNNGWEDFDFFSVNGRIFIIEDINKSIREILNERAMLAEERRFNGLKWKELAAYNNEITNFINPI